MSRQEAADRCYLHGTAVARAILWALALMLMTLLLGGDRATAEPEHRAGLVVTYASGTSVTRCITFSGQQISGLELLQSSGLSLVLSGSGMGNAVCKIGEVGCDDPLNCFCQCSGGQCIYWAYYHMGQDGAWHYSGVGASQYYLEDGDVDGWAWGPGGSGGGTLPDLYTFDDICGNSPVGGVAEMPPHPPSMPSEGNAAGGGEVLLGVAAALFLLLAIAAWRRMKRWL